MPRTLRLQTIYDLTKLRNELRWQLVKLYRVEKEDLPTTIQGLLKRRNKLKRRRY